MSKFIERLKQLSEGTPQPIGFGRREVVSTRPKIQLIVAVSGGVGEGQGTAAAGADAGFVSLSEAGATEKVLKSLAGVADIIWGVRIEGANDVEQSEKSGADFVVFPGSASLAALLEYDVGKVIEVDASLGEGLLRALNTMPVDAVLVSHHKEKEYAITFDDLMLFQRLSGLLRKPLLVPVPAGISDKEIRMLWEGGVDGIVVEMAADQTPGTIKKIRDMIAKLEYPSTKREEKLGAIAPRVALALPAEEEEEDDDDDDE